MTTHTPGPWTVEYDEEMGEHVIRMGRAVSSRCAHGVEEIIRYDHGLYEYEEEGADQFQRAEANARLIAAAPEMLEALKVAVLLMEEDGRCDCPEVEGGPCALCFARAAIAKATGGGP